MLVPRFRLLFWAGALIVPLATLAGMAPAVAPLAIVLIAAMVVVVLFDAAFAFGSLRGIHFEPSKVVRLNKDRPGKIELRIRNETAGNRSLKLGLPLPPEIESAVEELLVEVPGQNQMSRIDWHCTPRKRGNYLLDHCHAEGVSPMGFWAARTILPLPLELRVYPDLLKEQKKVAALFLNRGNLGIHALRQVGKGRDFEKLREYIPGDGYEDIHWKATAKRGRPVTKVFQIERTQEVYVIIDASRLSAREVRDPTAEPGAPQVSTLERFINAGLILALAAQRQGDLFGLVTFSDKVHDFIRARNGQAHYSLCRDALYTLHPRTVTPDYEELFSFLRLRLRRRALLVFLTALDDPLLAESFAKNAELICRQHLLLVNMVQPPGVKPLFTDADVARVDDLYQRLGGHVLWNNLMELGKTLQRRGVRFSLLPNEKLSTEAVTNYLQVRQRQLL